ncbi:sugar ABC transporter ATP-binding protein [Pseudonocardia sp. RS010]|uniref:sugar ABC transporter ATP-binding protein n=1 Tax=Pseudonocardia sp. RS010 TaxID=3385979 RepID=UPI0039A09EEF
MTTLARPDQDVLLRVTGLSKTFPGVRALDGVDLELRSGTVHALVGHNGSGKSTLIKSLSGFHRPDPGALFEWRDAAGAWRRSAAAGEVGSPIRVVHQNLGLVDGLSAVDNFALNGGFQPRRRGGIDWRAERHAAKEAIAPFGVRLDLDVPVGRLTQVQQTLVAIAIALRGCAPGEGVLILDEPTAVLPAKDARTLFATIARLRAAGNAILYVSHRLGEIFEISDTITVLREGRRVATAPTTEITRSELVRLMLGENDGPTERVARSGSEVAAIEVRDLRGRYLRGASFDVRRGEIVGFAGLPDDGREELPRVLGAGAAASSGAVRVGGVGPWMSVRSWRRTGVGYVTGDRAREGAFPTMTVQENLTLSALRSIGSRWLLTPRAERDFAATWATRVGIARRRLSEHLDNLSGGNQQKAVIGRALAKEPTLLVMSEPTAGVDIGTRLKIFALLAERAAAGLSIVVTSTDVDDLIALCDRVLVLQGGRVAGQLEGPRIDEPNLMRAMEGLGD